MRKRVLINDNAINELTFDALFHLSQPDQRDKLTAQELRATKTANSARHYASQMTLDEKLILLAKIGISFYFVLNKNDWTLKEFYDKYKDLTKGKKLTEASKDRLIVISDRTVVNVLNVMVSLTHSDGYILNMDFHRVGNFINTWKDVVPDGDNIAEATDHAKIINKLSLVLTMSMKGIREKTDIGDLDLNILMYLYDCGTRYVTREELNRYFGGYYKPTLITTALKRLQVKSLIEQNPTVRLPEYQITSFGTTAVMSFHTKNLQAV